MKKFIEICEEIEKTQKSIKTTEADKLEQMARAYTRHERTQNPEAAAQYEKQMKRADNEAKKNTHKKIIIEILKDNAKQAYLRENIGKICEIWNGYEGKPHGEKTAQKIREEIKRQTGADAYISNRYSDCAQITILNQYNNPIHNALRWEKLEFYAQNQRATTSENKIQRLDGGAFRVWYCGDYVADPEAHALEIIKAHEKARQAQENLRQLVSNYNTLTRGNMAHINDRENIYKFSI